MAIDINTVIDTISDELIEMTLNGIGLKHEKINANSYLIDMSNFQVALIFTDEIFSLYASFNVELSVSKVNAWNEKGWEESRFTKAFIITEGSSKGYVGFEAYNFCSGGVTIKNIIRFLSQYRQKLESFVDKL